MGNSAQCCHQGGNRDLKQKLAHRKKYKVLKNHLQYSNCHSRLSTQEDRPLGNFFADSLNLTNKPRSSSSAQSNSVQECLTYLSSELLESNLTWGT